MPASDSRVPSPSGDGAGQFNDLFPLGDWFRHHALRSFPILLFLALLSVPSIALVILDTNLSGSTFTAAAWIFAAYFATAWFLLLGVIVRPEFVTRPMLAVVVVIALATQVPLALLLETALHSSDTRLGLSIITVGIPEELVKAIPVVTVALLFRGRVILPRDYLFLGAVSGLAFGASEVVHYFTSNSIADFYRTVQDAAPAVRQLIATGHSASASIFAVLIHPVLYFIINFVWRFVTDPGIHACWAGVSGYFIGLAATRRHSWLVACVGLAIGAVLHGLNDWSRVNGRPAWILIVILSGVVFLGYARVGARTDQQFTLALPPVLRAHRTPMGQAAPPVASEPATTQAELGVTTPAHRRPPGGVHGHRTAKPWWQP